jgi:hypothetical protein
VSGIGHRFDVVVVVTMVTTHKLPLPFSFSSPRADHPTDNLRESHISYRDLSRTLTRPLAMPILPLGSL